MRRQLIDEDCERMDIFGELRMQLNRDEYAVRLDEIRPRKECIRGKLNFGIYCNPTNIFD